MLARNCRSCEILSAISRVFGDDLLHAAGDGEKVGVRTANVPLRENAASGGATRFVELHDFGGGCPVELLEARQALPDLALRPGAFVARKRKYVLHGGPGEPVCPGKHEQHLAALLNQRLLNELRRQLADKRETERDLLGEAVLGKTSDLFIVELPGSMHGPEGGLQIRVARCCDSVLVRDPACDLFDSAADLGLRMRMLGDQPGTDMIARLGQERRELVPGISARLPTLAASLSSPSER